MSGPFHHQPLSAELRNVRTRMRADEASLARRLAARHARDEIRRLARRQAARLAAHAPGPDAPDARP